MYKRRFATFWRWVGGAGEGHCQTAGWRSDGCSGALYPCQVCAQNEWSAKPCQIASPGGGLAMARRPAALIPGQCRTQPLKTAKGRSRGPALLSFSALATITRKNHSPSSMPRNPAARHCGRGGLLQRRCGCGGLWGLQSLSDLRWLRISYLHSIWPLETLATNESFF